MKPENLKQIKELLVRAVENIPLSGSLPDFYPNSEILDPIVKLYGKEIIDKYVIAHTVELILWKDCIKSYSPDELARYSDGITASILDRINFISVVDRAHDFLSTLPRQYEYIFPFPQSSKSFNVQITKDIGISKVRESFKKKYPSIISSGGGTEEGFNVKTGDVLLIIRNNGYVNSYGYTKKYRNDPLFIYKVISAFFEINSLFYKNYSLLGDRPIQSFNYGIIDSNNIPNGFVVTPSESSDDFEFVTTRELTTIEPIFAETISLLQKILKDKDMSSNAYNFRTSLLNSLYWSYEVEKTKQIHLQTIFLTTAFDSFFTQNDNKESKANNIANILAKDVEELELINKNLISLYDNRNKIIHGKASISSTEDNKYLDREMSKVAYPCRQYLTDYILNRVDIFINTFNTD